MRVDFGVLRNIIRDRNNKQKAATDSAECLREFLNLDTNLISKKGQLKDISNEGSLFREIKESVFKFCFPKVNIRLYKSEKELKELKEKYTQLETAYNELKNSIEVKDSE
ncbi:MAG: hypothetical protein ACI4E4_10380 [Acetatifactor sp.]